MGHFITHVNLNNRLLWVLCFAALCTSCTAYKFNKVRVDVSVLEDRIKQGATNFVIQFVAPDGQNTKIPIEATLYASYGSSGQFSEDRLNGTKDKSVKFGKSLLLGNNRLSIDSIQKVFQKLTPEKRVTAYFLFTPIQFSSGHIGYQYEVIVPGEEQEQSTDPLPTTQPCPPAICYER